MGIPVSLQRPILATAKREVTNAIKNWSLGEDEYKHTTTQRTLLYVTLYL